MKLKHNLQIALAAAFFALFNASCATTKTTTTTPDGVVTVTESTTLSGAEIATGATGIGGAVKTVTADK